ncbi:hypothetical protein KBTX_02695 [wastewater metagenome]|uniref:Uncharacterized protein n=2 Tax=unclassified sequences TaxID=12908 RepID=A0A5B8RE40_9ZZZZ|nr:hypothetical protein KBTEX_02695 [uncultured organism]
MGRGPCPLGRSAHRAGGVRGVAGARGAVRPRGAGDVRRRCPGGDWPSAVLAAVCVVRGRRDRRRWPELLDRALLRRRAAPALALLPPSRSARTRGALLRRPRRQGRAARALRGTRAPHHPRGRGHAGHARGPVPAGQRGVGAGLGARLSPPGHGLRGLPRGGRERGHPAGDPGSGGADPRVAGMAAAGLATAGVPSHRRAPAPSPARGPAAARPASPSRHALAGGAGDAIGDPGRRAPVSAAGRVGTGRPRRPRCPSQCPPADTPVAGDTARQHARRCHRRGCGDGDTGHRPPGTGGGGVRRVGRRHGRARLRP